MQELMQDCVERLYTYLKCMDDEEFQALMRRNDASIASWDRPKLSRNLLGSDLLERMTNEKNSTD